MTSLGYRLIPVVGYGAKISGEITTSEINAQYQWGDFLSSCNVVIHLAVRVVSDRLPDGLTGYRKVDVRVLDPGQTGCAGGSSSFCIY